MSDLPTLTVGVFSHNHATFVRQCLESLSAAVSKPVIVIVTDDGSTDETRDIIRQTVDNLGESILQFDLALSEENLRFPARLNEFLAKVRTPWFCVISADDEWLPGGLDRLIAAADRSPDAGLVFGDYIEIDEGGRPRGYSTKEGWLHEYAMQHLSCRPYFGNLMKYGCYIPGGATLTRAMSVQAANASFDTTLPNAEDFAFWLDLGPECTALHVDEDVFAYRILSTSKFRSTGSRRTAAILSIMGRHLGQLPTKDRRKALVQASKVWLEPRLGFHREASLSLREGADAVGVSPWALLSVTPAAMAFIARTKLHTWRVRRASKISRD